MLEQCHTSDKTIATLEEALHVAMKNRKSSEVFGTLTSQGGEGIARERLSSQGSDWSVDSSRAVKDLEEKLGELDAFANLSDILDSSVSWTRLQTCPMLCLRAACQWFEATQSTDHIVPTASRHTPLGQGSLTGR